MRPAAGAVARGPAEVVVQNPGRLSRRLVDGLARWVEELLAGVAPGRDSFVVRLATDAEMRRLNRRYRNRHGTTDVLSFPGGDGPEGDHLGDVVVSVSQARRQARGAGHDLGRELRILVLHGLLHCLGHDHEADDGAMERLERRLRERWLERG